MWLRIRLLGVWVLGHLLWGSARKKFIQKQIHAEFEELSSLILLSVDSTAKQISLMTKAKIIKDVQHGTQDIKSLTPTKMISVFVDQAQAFQNAYSDFRSPNTKECSPSDSVH
jgi:hypothetical protein